MRGLAVLLMVAACGGGGTKTTTAAGVPQNSSPVDCPSTAAVITRVLASENDVKDPTDPVKTAVAKRCDDDKWTADARSCLIAAKNGEALKDCGYNHLTQAQADKLNKAVSPLTSFDIQRAMAAMSKFKDQMCVCKDAACAQQVSDDMTKWSQELSKSMKEPPKMTEEDVKVASAIGEAMGKCMQAAMSASMPPPPPLAVTGLDPDRGDPAGGTYVVIKGTSFTADGPRNAKVYFGSKQATVIRFASDNELIVEAPGGKANEKVDIVVTFDPGGEMKLVKAFTYTKKKQK